MKQCRNSTGCWADGVNTSTIATAAACLGKLTGGCRTECGGGYGANTVAPKRTGKHTRMNCCISNTGCGNYPRAPLYGGTNERGSRMLAKKRPGKPDTGNPSVRFDEGSEPDGHWPTPFNPSAPAYSTIRGLI